MRGIKFKKRHIVLATSIVAVALVSFAAITARPQREREMQAAYDRLNLAMKHKNLPAYLAQLTPDYTEQRFMAAEESRPVTEARYGRLFADWISIDRQVVEVDKVEPRGSDLVAAVNKVTIGTMRDTQGAYGPKGRTHKLVTDSMDIDRWVKTNEGWKLKRRHIIMARISVDGKMLDTPTGGHVHENGHDD